MNQLENEIHWDAKVDAYRKVSDYTDLLKIIACYYEMYSRAVDFLGPWIAKQRGMLFLSPDREQIRTALGKDRPAISIRAKSAFIEALIQFLDKTRGKKTLITPSPSSHHSAQFPNGSFEIVEEKELSKNGKKVYAIRLAGADSPIYVDNLRLPIDQIKFLIIRPKLGKLGTANISKWEILFYKKNINYIIDHVDSNLNPRFSGIF
jgi:hypothetical protein